MRKYIFGIILIFLLIEYLTDDEYDKEERNEENLVPKTEEIIFHPQPENGFSPYDSYFGRGLYDKSTYNSFIIKNSNSTDVVVLLVDAYSTRKVRNEYIRKGETFSMTSVPNGTYFLRWMSGNYWSPDIMISNLKGGFQRDLSASQSDEVDDWMRADGGVEWTITLYSVSNGNMDTEPIDINTFGN